MNYRLIVSDFDGTLCRDDKSVSEENKIAIRNFAERGGVFAICTGRMLKSILIQARRIGLKGLVVSTNGAVIADIESGEVIYDKGIDLEVAIEVTKFLEEKDEHIHVYLDGEFYTNKDDVYKKMYEKLCEVEGHLVTEKLSSFINDRGQHLQKMLCILPEERRGVLMTELNQRFGDKLIITTSSPMLVEIIDKRQTKGTAIKYLSKHFNIPIENSIGIGDSENDIDLLRESGFAVAVGNATEELKKYADLITCTNEENAVAKIIEEYGI